MPNTDTTQSDRQPTKPEPRKVVDLMAALEESVNEAKAARTRHLAKAAKEYPRADKIHEIHDRGEYSRLLNVHREGWHADRPRTTTNQPTEGN
jgi:hypothetical protein